MHSSKVQIKIDIKLIYFIYMSQDVLTYDMLTAKIVD